MSVPRLSPPLPTADAESATEAMRGRGMRITAARRLVVEALHEAGRPVTAEELASGMYGRFPRTDLASVYRNLETLEDAGIVQHMHLGHGPGLYAPTGSAQEYVACERCGRSWNTAQIPAEEYQGLLRRMRRHKIEVLAVAAIVAAILVPLIVFVSGRVIAAVPLVMAIWLFWFLPYWRRRYRRTAHEAPRWELHPE